MEIEQNAVVSEPSIALGTPGYSNIVALHMGRE